MLYENERTITPDAQVQDDGYTCRHTPFLSLSHYALAVIYKRYKTILGTRQDTLDMQTGRSTAHQTTKYAIIMWKLKGFKYQALRSNPHASEREAAQETPGDGN